MKVMIMTLNINLFRNKDSYKFDIDLNMFKNIFFDLKLHYGITILSRSGLYLNYLV